MSVTPDAFETNTFQEFKHVSEERQESSWHQRAYEDQPRLFKLLVGVSYFHKAISEDCRLCATSCHLWICFEGPANVKRGHCRHRTWKYFESIANVRTVRFHVKPSLIIRCQSVRFGPVFRIRQSTAITCYTIEVECWYENIFATGKSKRHKKKHFI